MASIGALMSALTTMPKERVLSALKVAATEITEESLLNILGDYMNYEVGIKKRAARTEIYSNYEKEYYLVLGIVHPSGLAGVPKEKEPAEQISQLMTDLAGSTRNDLIGKLKCDEDAITQDSLLHVLADFANLILYVKKSSARATIYFDCEPQYRQILSVLKPEDDARSRKRELADSDDGGNIKKARVGAAPPPTSLEGPCESAMLLLLQKFGKLSLVKKVESRSEDMEKQWLGLRSLWDRSQRLPTQQQGLGLGASIWTPKKKTCDFVLGSV